MKNWIKYGFEKQHVKCSETGLIFIGSFLSIYELLFQTLISVKIILLTPFFEHLISNADLVTF
jgi:hypothetical protein